MVAARSLGRVLLVLFAVWSTASAALAQQVQVQLQPPKLQVGQTGRMTVFFVGGKTRGAPQFDVPEGLEVEFDGSYQRFQDNGFERTMIYAYRYRITALQEGRFELGGWTFDLGRAGKATSDTRVLTVVPREELEVDRLEVSAGFDVEEAWEGQVVVYDYELVAGVPTMGVDWRLPDFDGLRPTTSGGATTREYLIDDPKGGTITITGGSIPLVATGTGDRSQPAALASVRVPVGRPGFMGLRQYRSERAVGPEASLIIRPLTDVPANFSGLVGDFEFRQVVDERNPAVGQSVNWTLQVVGDGSLDGWTPPELAPVDGITMYDSDGTVNAAVQDGEYRAVGRFKRVLVPSAAGPVSLPDYEIVSFSPSRGEFVTHRLDLPDLDVRAGTDGEVDVQSFSDGTAPTGSGDSIDFRENYGWGLSVAPRLVPVLPMASVLAAAPAVGVLALAGLGWIRERRAALAVTEERPPTPAERLGRLPTDREERMAALDGVLRQALADHEGVEVSTLDRDGALEGLPDELRFELRRVWRALDRARFASGPSEGLEDTVRRLVESLEGLGG